MPVIYIHILSKYIYIYIYLRIAVDILRCAINAFNLAGWQFFSIFIYGLKGCSPFAFNYKNKHTHTHIRILQ